MTLFLRVRNRIRDSLEKLLPWFQDSGDLVNVMRPIDQNLDEKILSPMLDDEFEIQVTEFKLDTKGEVLDLHCTVCGDGEGMSLRLVDFKGRDLSAFFPKSSKVTFDQTISGTGVVAGGIAVKFCGIWPPATHSQRPVGGAQYSTANVRVSKIEEMVSGLDIFTSSNLSSILEASQGKRLEELEIDLESTSCESGKFEHIAVFKNTHLEFVNTAFSRTSSHPFWGGSSSEMSETYDGEAFCGQFSLKRKGDHLEVGLICIAENDKTAKQQFDAFLSAVGFVLAIQPWPIYKSCRKDGRLLRSIFKSVTQTQGSFFPMRSRHTAIDPASLSKLISKLSSMILNQSDERRKKLKNALWIFRGADSRLAPPPLQRAMIGTVVESLLKMNKKATEIPDGAKEVQQAALKALDEFQESSDQSGKELANFLKNHISIFEFGKRREEWANSFSGILPDHPEYVGELFQIFKKARNAPVHGDFGIGDPLDAIDTTGKLAAFVNVIIAAMAGYSGTLSNNVNGDTEIELKDVSDYDSP